MMPDNLVLIRHGQSEGNIAVDASLSGDDRLYTDNFMNTPGHKWRLSKLGRQQASVMGEWLNTQFGDSFDKFYVSPFVRTRETAGTLNLRDARWVLNRDVREQDWGDISSLPYSLINELPHLRDNLRRQKQDPLYWTPPNGESLAMVAENRVNNLLSKLVERCDEGDDVIVQTHNEFMWATRLIVERWTDELFAQRRVDNEYKIPNCGVIHYSRVNPATGERSERFLEWMRFAEPVYDEAADRWDVKVSGWQQVVRPVFSNEELLTSVENFESFIAD